eukprot:g3684.t1
MSISEAIKGAQVEFSHTHGWLPRLRCVCRLTGILTQELLSPLTMVRYGMHALWKRHRLMIAYYPYSSRDKIINGRYGTRPRNLIDLYQSSMESSWSPGIDESPDSVVLFVHGGVWSSGERWHYSPLASTLAENSMIVGVMSYSLFPEVSAAEIIDEVNTALDWVMNKFNKNSQKVTLVGHSSGAHCVMMAMLNRCKQSKKMPDQVICISGVYDIAQHYQFEKDRGVHEISMMKRAMGGIQNFKSLSPTCILTDLKDSKLNINDLPKIVLITSLADCVVPSVQSHQLHDVLRELGCDSTLLHYNDIVHSHFVTKCWTSSSSNFTQDFIALLKSDATVQKETKSVASSSTLESKPTGIQNTGERAIFDVH